MTRPLQRTLGVIVVLALLTAGAVGVDRTVIRPSPERDGLLVALVIGSDIGPPYRPGDPLRGRADAIHVIAVDPAERSATVVDIPRDSVIGGTKVNAHLAMGGPEALVAQLESFTGLTIDYWLVTTFHGFETLTTDIRGVDVVVEQPMHDDASKSDFEPGPVRIQGAEALAYARDRHSLPDGDFGRTRHQGDLLLAAHRRLVEDRSSLPDLVALMGSLARNTVSNIPRTELLPLALLAAGMDPDSVEHVPLTGRTGTLGSASVVFVEPGDTFTRISDGRVGPELTRSD
ncbi:MAG TPA: LCP family protein [Euzebyales bacterium]|nr:LCP family protein [Euzebyales bacterium]